MKQFLLFLVLFLFSWTIVYATDNQDTYQVGIVQTNTPIKIDGLINETGWQTAKVAKDFWQKWPVDTVQALSQTEVRLLYDANFIYVSAICWDSQDLIQTLKRDVGHWNSDGFAVLLDPMNEHNNGFLFGVNAGGAQMDGLVVVNQNSPEWDAKWYSAVKHYEDRWEIEMAIPLKSIRYKETIREWGINFIRNDMKRNTYSTWAQVPLQMRGIDLGFTGKLFWDTPPKKVKGNAVLIPYMTGGTSRNHEDGEENRLTGNIGLDTKIALSSSLNLDLTINPDFSQVDVDQQVTNLSRFSLFFPERRNFFLENSDLFSNFGTDGTRPFFSRKIGIREDETVPIVFGARLTGNLTSNTRVGVLSMQTAETSEYAAQNYSIGTVQQRVLKRSTIKALWINRQAFNQTENHEEEAYNRVGGLEFNYLSQNGTWQGNLRYHQSFNPESNTDTQFYSADFGYNPRKLWLYTSFSKVGENYIADLGFTPRLYNYDAARDTSIRKGYYQWNGRYFYDLYPKESKKVNLRYFGIAPSLFFNEEGSLNEANVTASYGTLFKDRSRFWIDVKYNQVVLPFATEIIESDTHLPAERYEFVTGRVAYESNQRKKFFWKTFYEQGTFYNGTIMAYGGGINFRAQPWGNIGVDISQNRIQLPENYGKANLTLISPKIEISFSNNLFWTTFMQYNTQADNFNINSRFQWRFKPMSDLFVVYTDNYVANSFKVKNRGLVFKINYWLNL